MSEIKLLHGDCLKLLPEIPDESVDLILTDIPYNISRESRITFMPDRTGRVGIDFGKWDYGFDVNNLSLLQKKLRKGGSFISFHAFMQSSDIQSAMPELEFKNFIVWEKTNSMPRNPNRRYICNVETASWYVKSGKPWTYNQQRFPYDGSICSYPSESGGGFDRYHPCQKPQALLEELIQRHSNVGDVIFDPFMGSGSMGVAAYNLDRGFIGIEIDDTYYDVAVQRIEAAKAGATPKMSNDKSKAKALF